MGKLVTILSVFAIVLCHVFAGPVTIADQNCECKHNDKLNITELLCKSKQLTSVPDFGDIECVFDKVVIASNDIAVIANDTFVDAPGVSVAHLYTNNIETIDEDAFKSLPNLQEVDLSDNDLLTFDPWIFSENALLETVVLSDNPLVDVDIMSPILSSESVTTLLLDGCKLTTITKEMLSELPSLEVLDISSNNIKTLPLRVFDDVPNLNRLELHNNRWICDCDLKYLLIFADRIRDNRTIPMTPVKCVTPERDMVVWSDHVSEKYCPAGTIEILVEDSVEIDVDENNDLILKMDAEIDVVSDDSADVDDDSDDNSDDSDVIVDQAIVESSTEYILLADQSFLDNLSTLDTVYSFLIILSLLILTLALTAWVVRRVRSEQQALPSPPPTSRANNVDNKFYMMNVHSQASAFTSTDQLLANAEHKDRSPDTNTIVSVYSDDLPIVFQYPARSNVHIYEPVRGDDRE